VISLQQVNEAGKILSVGPYAIILKVVSEFPWYLLSRRADFLSLVSVYCNTPNFTGNSKLNFNRGVLQINKDLFFRFTHFKTLFCMMIIKQSIRKNLVLYSASSFFVMIVLKTSFLQPPIQWVQGALSLGVRRPGREADHTPPSSADVKNVWSYTSTLPIRLRGVVLS
jgi:hypothetical protein